MKYNVFVSYDKQIEAYGQPQFSNLTKEDYCESIRRGLALGKLDKGMAKECEIAYLGEYDDKTGRIVLEEKPVTIMKLADYLPPEVTKVE